ncbi:MAG: restriction endonuclease subunit S [Opitutales bacterium]
MTLKITLEKLARLRSGFSIRKKAAQNPDKSFPILQIRDFDEISQSVKLPLTSRTSPAGKLQEHFLAPNDILFLAKGTRHLCFRPGQLPEPTLPADSFFVISPQKDILPAYLVWYLNLPATRHTLERDAGGSRTPIIRIDALRTLAIPIPPLETQHKITRLVELHRREKEKLLKLAELRERQINQITQTLSRT